jgi:hypothetical protein
VLCGRACLRAVVVQATRLAFAHFLRGSHLFISFFASQEAKFFLKPVTKDVAADYDKVIKQPMDFGQVKVKLADDKYSIPKTFLNDCKLIFDNAKVRCVLFCLPAPEISQTPGNRVE